MKILLYPYNFFMHYLPNHIVNKIPFYFIRNFYYKKIMKIEIGKNSSIHMNVFINRNNIIIGESSVVNRNCYLDGRGKIIVGNNVSISPNVNLITADHDINSKGFVYREKDIYIADYVFIGTGAIILPGITLGKGSVIAAGSVVTTSVKDYEIVGGVPATKIGKRREDLEYECKWFPPFD